MSLRSVTLPTDASGQLLLTAMPGTMTPLSAIISDMQAAGVKVLVCLNGDTEIQMRSPEYWNAIIDQSLPFDHVRFPIHDFGTPRDVDAFATMVKELADRLQNGDTVAVHCAAGIGRTGLTSVSILMALGLSLEQATRNVSAAGSHAEDPSQVSFLTELETKLS